MNIVCQLEVFMRLTWQQHKKQMNAEDKKEWITILASVGAVCLVIALYAAFKFNS
jgi:hypothetical protein